jgi:2-keto-3-deoxy-L-rhamnonate aldolase RhmA
MAQWQHPVRAKLAAGEFVLAATLTTNSLDSAALIATLGFDFLWVEMEHSPITLETLRGMVLATRGLPAALFARVPVNELWTAKRVMDQGVSGVIFPFTSNAQLAQRAAQACKYPPVGLRGSGAGLATSTWPELTSYYDSADRNMVVITVIEEACAVECIDDIAATPGIDVLFIGTSDLAFSLGLRGRQNEPKLQAAIDRIVEAAQRHNKFLGRPAGTAEQIIEYRKQGFQMFQCQTDLGLISLGARHLLEPLGIRGMHHKPPEIKTDQPKPLY